MSLYVSDRLVCRFGWKWQFHPNLHTRRSPTQSDMYQMSYLYNWFSWWWTQRCSKHVENWNKYSYIRKNNLRPVGYLQEFSLIYFARTTSLQYEVCTYIYIYIYIYIYTHTHTHISNCVDIVRELPSLQTNTVSEAFLQQSKALRSIDSTFVIGAPACRCLGEYVTLDKSFTVSFSNRSSGSASYFRVFFLIAFSEEAFIINKIQ